MEKRDTFISQFVRVNENFKGYLRYYERFIKTNYNRRKGYKQLMRSLKLLREHINSESVYKAYSENEHFESTLIKWLADLNFLTAQSIPYELCIMYVYQYVDKVNNLVYDYFKEEE